MGEPYRGSTSAALRFSRATVKMQIPKGIVGAYLLWCHTSGHPVPVYIGRSDTCLRRRLLGHPLLGTATHFVCAPARSRREAYVLESYWYHRYRSKSSMANQIHPASPSGTGWQCPICPETAIEQALQRALPQPRDAREQESQDG